MPHGARGKSGTSYYHVVPKGIAGQLIFDNDSDKRLYVKLLAQAQGEYGVRIHAYCLMSNHVHLILEDPDDRLSDFMKYVQERYAMHYAKELGRTGGIFRKPFWSEPIDTDAHLLCAVRYVHANPAAAGICEASAYEWSSAKDYLGRKGITYTTMVLAMTGGREGFIRFSNASNATALPFSGSRLRSHLSDEEALVIAQTVLGKKRFSSFSSMDPDAKAIVLRELLDRGFSQTQLARIMGISKSYIHKLSV